MTREAFSSAGTGLIRFGIIRLKPKDLSRIKFKQHLADYLI